MIRSGADVAQGFDAKVDVCIVGSGAGGGVAAAVAAEAGRTVLVLEEGPYVPGSRMTQREEQMYPLLFRDGGNQLTDDGGVSVLQGRVVGGSTVVNMADVERIPEPVAAHWRTKFGVDRWSAGTLEEAAALCAEVIGANVIPQEGVNRNNGLLQLGAGRIGMTTRTFEHNRVGCIGSGYCLVGCAYDAKRSVALTWLPRAIATGNTIVQAEARVERLEHDGGRIVAATGHVVADWKPIAPFRVEADEFVLAAGAVHSPALLLASGLGGPAVGHNLTLQPQAPAVALFPEDVVLFRGIPQSVYVEGTEMHSEEDGLGGYRIEGVSATPGMAAATSALDTATLHRFMGRFRQATAALCLVPDRPTGRVTLGKEGRPHIRYALSEAVEATLRQAVHTAARIYLAAGADEVLLPFHGAGPVRSEADLGQLETLRFRTASSPLISAHPQGTCRVGRDPATSVVDLDLKVHGLDNLRILDASVFPTSAATHTMLPVMTFAWLGAQALGGMAP